MSRLNPLFFPVLNPLPPQSFILEGFPWDETLTQIPGTYYTQGNYKVFQANLEDAVGGSLHVLEAFTQTAYNAPVRLDWVMKVDQTLAQWQMGAIASHLVLQCLSTDTASYFGANIWISVKNGEFVCNRTFPDGSPPGGTTVELATFPVTPGREYVMSVRILPHLTAGSVEFWLDGALIGSDYNVETTFSTSDFICEVGMYRFSNSPFTTPVRVLHSPMRTGKFELLG